MYFTGVSASLEREGVAKTGISRIKNDLDLWQFLYLTGVLIVADLLFFLWQYLPKSLCKLSSSYEALVVFCFSRKRHISSMPKFRYN